MFSLLIVLYEAGVTKMCHEKIFLAICYRFAQRLAIFVIRQRFCVRVGIAYVNKNRHNFIGRELQKLFCFIRVKIVYPAGVQTDGFGGQYDMCCNNSGVLCTGVILAARIFKYIAYVVSDGKYSRRIIAAGCDFVCNSK